MISVALNNPRRRVYLFAGGGTGGHLYPAVAIAEKLREWNPLAEIHFVGTARGLEARVVPDLGYPLHLTAVRGFARKRFWANLASPFMLLWSLVQSAIVLKRVRPEVVIGTGGYVSGPMLFVAHLLGYPTIIQEQNSYPGVTTRLLSRWVDRVHISFAESISYFSGRKNVFVTGNPVRDLRVDATPAQARQRFGLAPDKPTLLVFGGSQGARVINQAVIKILSRLVSESKMQLIWSSGKWNQEEVRQAAVGSEESVSLTDFISDMPVAYRAADVVLSRAGALTLAEINVCGLPSVLIPFAAAAGNHQEANALAMAKMGSAVVILERDLPQRDLAAEIIALLGDPGRREKMGKAAQAAAFASASTELARAVLELESKRNGEEE